MRADDPIGHGNERAVENAIRAHRRDAEFGIGPVVCAWGVHGPHLGRDRELFARLRRHPWLEPMCLGLTKAGHPKHPLYVRLHVPLIPFRYDDLIQ
jgi:hypothetical protein